MGVGHGIRQKVGLLVLCVSSAPWGLERIWAWVPGVLGRKGLHPRPISLGPSGRKKKSPHAAMTTAPGMNVATDTVATARARCPRNARARRPRHFFDGLPASNLSAGRQASNP